MHKNEKLVFDQYNALNNTGNKYFYCVEDALHQIEQKNLHVRVRPKFCLIVCSVALLIKLFF